MGKILSMVKSESLLIRRFSQSDTQAVTSLWLTVFPDDPPRNAPGDIIRRKLAVQPNLFWVGVFEAQVVATVMAGYDGNRGWIYHLAVAPHLRGKGFGRAMMAQAEKSLRALDCSKINLQVRASNARTVRFYEMSGYKIEERISMGKRLD
jgi:ribosomal protein S18 acetylase RimI-like enzyme